LAAARGDLAIALLAVRLYGCDARRNLAPLATPIERPWRRRWLASRLRFARLGCRSAEVIVLGFSFPDELHYLVEHQVWARVEDSGVARVGITSLGIHLAGDEIYMARPKGVGHEVVQGGSIGVVELAKAIVSVKSPVGGVVVAVNGRLAAEPELVHRDPYGLGWIACVRLADFAADAAGLLHGEATVRPAMERHAWLNNVAAR
jgi:glycine cleavage system H protein